MSENSVTKQFVVFKLGEEEYGIDILRVKTIEKMSAITRVPKAEPYVKGVINLRGEVVPIIDLGEKFSLDLNNSLLTDSKEDALNMEEEIEETENTRIIIIYAEDIVLGIIVDAASEVIEISDEFIEAPPESLGNIDTNIISGIGKINDRIIIILDAYKILNI